MKLYRYQDPIGILNNIKNKFADWSDLHMIDSQILSLGIGNIKTFYPPGMEKHFHHGKNLINIMQQLESSQPHDPDYYICPIVFLIGLYDTPEMREQQVLITTEVTNSLPEFKNKPEKHIFFQSGDNPKILSPLEKSIVFKQSSAIDDNSLPFTYSTAIPEPSAIPDIESCHYDVTFHGSLFTHSLRHKIPDTLLRCWQNKLTTLLISHQFWSVPIEQRNAKREGYAETLADSKFILCPRGAGLGSIRFYETLQFGRIPVHISNNAKLPLKHLIRYDEFMVNVPEEDIAVCHKYIRDFMDKRDLKIASKLARQTWETYFSPNAALDFVMSSLRPKTKMLML